jgi:hypothetical protein
MAFFFGGIFILINIIPLLFSAYLTWNFFCIPVLFCGFIFYIVVFTWLIRLSKFVKINFTLLLFIICLVLNITVKSKYHNVRFITKGTDSISCTSNTTLTDYFAAWLMHRKHEIDTNAAAKCYPVFLVNAYGGGIRAASFTSFVIHGLNGTVSKQDSLSRPFEHFVFSYSGASGGTIGASVMCAFRYDSLLGNVSRPMSDSMLMDFYNRDYLTTLVAGVIGRDSWAAGTGLDLWDDRSVVQEKLWERHLWGQWNVDYRKNYYSCWNTGSAKTKYEVPLLFSNTCNVDNGLKGILSPVHLEHSDFPGTDFVSEQIPEKQSIALSTAAFLSARFPWISPTGKTNDDFHFIDGGVKENSGAETSENIYLALMRFLNQPKDSMDKYNPGVYPYAQKIRLFFVSIGNSSHSKSGSHRKVKNLFQLTSPLIALYNSGVDGNSQKADSTIRFRYPKNYASFWPDVDCIPYDTLKNKTVKIVEKYSPAFPLGWQISLGALRRIKLSAYKQQYYDMEADSVPGFKRVMGFMKGDQ